MTEVLINEWVSLWDHWTIWGLSLHHSCKFLSHLRNLQPAMRNLVPFLWSERNIFTFILTNSIKAADLQKSIRSGSYLTTQHRPLSFLKRSNLLIFQESCVFLRIFQPNPIQDPGWVRIAVFQLFPSLPIPISFNWEEAGICHTPPNCLENSTDRGAWRATVHGVAKELDITSTKYT